MTSMIPVAKLSAALEGLLAEDWPAMDMLIRTDTPSLALALRHGRYDDVLRSECFAQFWAWAASSSSHQTSLSAGGVGDFVSALSMREQQELWAVGVAALQLFVRTNWTGGGGGRVDDDGEKDLPAGVDALAADVTLVAERVVVDGESLCSVVKKPGLLALSVVILDEQLPSVYAKHWVFKWWALRSTLIQQEALTEHSATLHDRALRLITSIELHAEFQKLPPSSSHRIHLKLEAAHFHATFHETAKARACVQSACEAAGITLSETGVMGKRTKFQQHDLPQLTLDIKSSSSSSSRATTNEDVEKDLPTDLRLDDEVRLEKIKFSETVSEEALSPTEQAVVLSAFTLKLRSQPRDSLTNEELMPYLEAVLRSSPTRWALRTSALLHRSKLESSDRRTVERAMMQVQTLVDNIAEGGSPDRLSLIYVSRLPPQWSVEGQLCTALRSMGSVKAALDVALRIELWEDVIHCYHQLQLRHKAADVIRMQIETKGETPLLCCMLGDATDELEHYHRALELSNNKSARAYRALGVYYYFRQEYEQAVENLRRSVELNGYQLNTLLRLGYAATKIEDWELSAQTYRKYCSYESDNFEAWNNLSNAYIKLGQKARAWKVLQEAVKCDYDNWKIWDNIMVVSVDCGHFEDVIRSYHRVLDLKEKHVDVQVLELLVKSIVDDLRDNMDRPCSQFRGDALKLFGRLTSQAASDGRVWELYSDLTLAGEKTGEEEEEEVLLVKACQLMQKSAACLSQRAGWEKDRDKCKEVLTAAVKYARRLMDLGNTAEKKTQAVQLMSSAKMSLKGIATKVKQSQTSVATGEIVEDLKQQVEELDRSTEELVKAITSMNC